MYWGIINQCMGTPRGFHWKNTQISLMQAVVEITFALHSGNTKILHQILQGCIHRARKNTIKSCATAHTKAQKGLHQSPAPNRVKITQEQLPHPSSSLQTPEPALRAPFIPNSQIKGRSQGKAASPHPARALPPKALGMAPQPLD